MDQHAIARDLKTVRGLFDGLDQALRSTATYTGEPLGAGPYQIPAFLRPTYQAAQDALKRLERELL